MFDQEYFPISGHISASIRTLRWVRKIDNDSEVAQAFCGIAIEIGKNWWLIRHAPVYPRVHWYFPSGWGNLCLKYGHAQNSCGAFTYKVIQDLFPETVSVLDYMH